MEKYLPSVSGRIITNDLYLAAYLLCEGCELASVERNRRRRVSFVFAGAGVRRLRAAYTSGPVRVDVRLFRDNLIHVRRLVDAQQRSVRCPNPSPTALSPA